VPQRRWYGAVVLAAVVVCGCVHGRPPDMREGPAPAQAVVGAPAPDRAARLLPPTPLGKEPAATPNGETEIQKVDYRPPPAPPPSELEAAADKRRAKSPPAMPTAPAGSAAVVSLEVVGPATAAPGQLLSYEIVVRNTGAAAVAKVRVEDELPADVRMLQSEPVAEIVKDRMAWSLGDLAAGTERRIKVVVQPAVAGGVTPEPSVSFTMHAVSRPRVVRPALVVTQVAPETAQRGQSVPFEIRVTNNGVEPLQQVVVRDQIPPGLQFMRGNLVEAEIGALGPNESKTVRLDAQAVQTGRVVNEITASAAGGLTARCEAAVLIQEPGLEIKLDGSRQATVGGEWNLRVELTNAGSKPVLGVGLLVTLPDGIEPISTSTGGTVDPNNRHLVGWTSPSLASGERQTVALKAKANAAGSWVCQASVRADGLAENKASAALQIEAAPSLRLEIVGRDDAIDNGAETVYEIRVSNQGEARCAGVRLVGQVGAGLQVRHAEGPTAAVIQGESLQFDPLPSLPGRTEALYRLTVRGQKAGDFGIRIRLHAESLAEPLQKDVNLRVTGNSIDPFRPTGGGSISGPPR
jgi:uncharacterized repeat protein (TIGR01451 family)